MVLRLQNETKWYLLITAKDYKNTNYESIRKRVRKKLGVGYSYVYSYYLNNNDGKVIM